MTQHSSGDQGAIPEPPAGWGIPPGAIPPAGSGAAPGWTWAAQQPVLVPVETEPLEYHRLYRGAPRYRWWKPLLVLLLAASIYFIFNIVFSVLFVPILMLFDPEYLGGITTGTGEILDTQHPLSVLMGLVTIALMIPAVILAMLALGMRPVGRVWSVAGRIRWSLLWRTMGAALIAVIVMNGVGMVIEGVTAAESTAGGASAGEREFDPTAAIISFALVLLLVPLQATAEEVVFRGLFLQVIGSWLRSPWIAIALSTLVFAAGHIYDIWGLIAVGLMGLVAAWLTWKTGGLEAAISIHILNNIAAFGVMASGLAGETAQVEESGGPLSLVGEAAGLAVFAWLTMRIWSRYGYGRERIDVVIVPSTEVSGAAAPGAWMPGAALPPDGVGGAGA